MESVRRPEFLKLKKWKNKEEDEDCGHKSGMVRRNVLMLCIVKTGLRRKRFRFRVCYMNLKTNSATTAVFIAISQQYL
jgi:ribosomal protein S14